MGKDLAWNLEQSSQTAGDCTAMYNVSFNRDITLNEFMNELLTKRIGDWGLLDLYEHGNIEYKWGKIIKGDWASIGDKKVIMADAHGGWSRMDYRLLIE